MGVQSSSASPSLPMKWESHSSAGITNLSAWRRAFARDLSNPLLGAGISKVPHELLRIITEYCGAPAFDELARCAADEFNSIPRVIQSTPPPPDSRQRATPAVYFGWSRSDASPPRRATPYADIKQPLIRQLARFVSFAPPPPPSVVPPPLTTDTVIINTSATTAVDAATTAADATAIQDAIRYAFDQLFLTLTLSVREFAYWTTTQSERHHQSAAAVVVEQYWIVPANRTIQPLCFRFTTAMPF